MSNHQNSNIVMKSLHTSPLLKFHVKIHLIANKKNVQLDKTTF
jgi:hypothetical protein